MLVQVESKACHSSAGISCLSFSERKRVIMQENSGFHVSGGGERTGKEKCINFKDYLNLIVGKFETLGCSDGCSMELLSSFLYSSYACDDVKIHPMSK